MPPKKGSTLKGKKLPKASACDLVASVPGDWKAPIKELPVMETAKLEKALHYNALAVIKKREGGEDTPEVEARLDRIPMPAENHLSRMTPEQRFVREQFVAEYMFDHDFKGAALRVGFPEERAFEAGKALMSETGVQRLLRERLSENTEEHGITTGRIIGMYLDEISDRGPTSSQSARVACIGALAKIAGLQKATEVNVKVLGGIMLIPPVTPSVDAWAAEAEVIQDELHRAVRD
jgi:hypothetical protein